MFNFINIKIKTSRKCKILENNVYILKYYKKLL